MVIELDAFSGRPNPSWALSEAEAAELAGLIAVLKPAAAGTLVRPPGLGYRGFLIDRSDGKGYRAYRGVVESPGRVLTDPERSIEGFLLEHTPEDLKDLRSWLRGEIDA